MPNDVQETNVYAVHKFAKDENQQNQMMTDLKNRIQKLEDTGKLPKGYGDQTLPYVESIAIKNIHLSDMDQDGWWTSKYDYCRGVESFMKKIGFSKEYDRRRFGKWEFSDWSKEGFSFLYAIVEQAEKGKDLSDNDKITEFYKKEFEPNYVPNIEFRKKKEEEEKKFDEWVEYRKEQARLKDEEQKKIRAFNAKVAKYAKDYQSMLEEQENALSNYSYVHASMADTGDWEINDSTSLNQAKFYDKHLANSRAKLDEVLKQFDKEAKMEAQMKADTETERILQEAKSFHYIKGMDLRYDIRSRDDEIKHTIDKLCTKLSHADTNVYIERDNYDFTFKKQLKAYEAIRNNVLTPEKDEQTKKLYEEFKEYHKTHLEHQTHSYEIMVETFDQLEKLKAISPKVAEYVNERSAFVRRLFVKYQDWKRDYEKQMDDHEKLLAENIDNYKRLTTEFDEKWNKTTEELKNLIKEGYDLENNVENQLIQEHGGTNRLVGVTPKTLETFLSTHEVYKKNLGSKREEILQKTAQALRLLDERDDLIKKTGDESLKTKYDLSTIEYTGTKVKGGILKVSKEVQSALTQEQQEVDSYSRDAKKVASEYYADLLEEKRYEALLRKQAERLEREAEIERQRIEREMQAVEDECRRIDEELDRTREQRYRNEDTAKYLDNMVDGLDRKQQADILEAYGLDKDEREKFLNGQKHLLSFLKEQEDNKQNSNENTAENVEKNVLVNTANTNAPANKSAGNKDLTVALATRQALLNQINKNSDELYQNLVKRYNLVRTGNYSEEQKNNYYKDFEKEIEEAKNSDRLNRGKLNMSEKVCNILALGQKVHLPVFEKDNLTVLSDAIKSREAVVAASVQAAELEEKLVAEREQFESEKNSALNELSRLIQESKKADEAITILRENVNTLINTAKPTVINNYQKDYYNPRKNGLDEFKKKLSQHQLSQSGNLEKMDELREKLEKMAAQAKDPDIKDQINEVLKQHDGIVSRSYGIMGYDLDVSLDNALEELTIDERTTKNQNLSDKISKAEEFAKKWLDDYEQTFSTEEPSKQIKALQELKKKYEDNKSVIPAVKIVKTTLNNNEKFLNQHDMTKDVRDVVTQQYNDLGDQYDRTIKNLDQVSKYADEIDSLIESIGYEKKINDIRISLKNEYDSFKQLNNYKDTKNRTASQFQNEMNTYMAISLDKLKKGNYSDEERREAPAQFLQTSLDYLNHLNNQMESTDTREALRAYQEKGVLINTFKKMIQLPEFYADADLDEALNKEEERSTSDRQKAESAVEKLRKENAERDQKFKKDVENLKNYVKDKVNLINDEFKKTDNLESFDDEFDIAEKEAIEQSKNATELAKNKQSEANSAFENAKDKKFADDPTVIAANETVKTELTANETAIMNEISDLGKRRKTLSAELGAAKRTFNTNVSEKNDLKSYVKQENNALSFVDNKVDELKKKVEDSKTKDDNEEIKGLKEVVKTFDSQMYFEAKFGEDNKNLHNNLESLHTRAINRNNEINESHAAVLDKQNQIKQNLTGEKDAYDKLIKEFTEASNKQKKLCAELDVKQREAATRRAIKETFDAIKDSKDKGIGSHEKFRNFKNAMQEYLNVYPDGHLAENLSPAEAKILGDNAYKSCIEYVNRHLKTNKGLQYIDHQRTDDGALRKQGTVRILELMKELPEFKNRFELTAENNQIDEVAPAPKDKANSKKEDKRVKINFSQLKNSLGENAKSVKAKKKEDYQKNAYADLNEAINNKKGGKENTGKKH